MKSLKWRKPKPSDFHTQSARGYVCDIRGMGTAVRASSEEWEREYGQAGLMEGGVPIRHTTAVRLAPH
jgi:hypothetical protein